MRTWFILGAALAAVSGCDDGNARNADLSAVADLKPPPPDMAKMFDLTGQDFAGVRCGAVVCQSTEVCCVRPVGAAFKESCIAGTDCGPGAAPATCDGPEDCMTGEGCCAQVSFQVPDGGTVAQPQSGAAACNLTCNAEVTGGAATGTTNFTSKLCHTPTDCADYVGEILGGTVKFDGCCYRPEVDFHFCAPDDVSYETAGGYKCL